MVEAFDFFDCVPREVWWDNPKTVAKEILKGRRRKLHDRYARARIYERKSIESKIAALCLDITESFYMTAPMDVIRWRPLQRLLRKSIFGPDRSKVPVLATEVFVAAQKRRP